MPLKLSPHLRARPRAYRERGHHTQERRVPSPSPDARVSGNTTKVHYLAVTNHAHISPTTQLPPSPRPQPTSLGRPPPRRHKQRLDYKNIGTTTSFRLTYPCPENKGAPARLREGSTAFSSSPNEEKGEEPMGSTRGLTYMLSFCLDGVRYFSSNKTATPPSMVTSYVHRT